MLKVVSDCIVSQVAISGLMEGCRCVSVTLGAPYAITIGTREMPVSCVDNWAIHHMV